MMFQSTPKRPFQFTGFHMTLCMVAFFSVIIVVNFGMAMLASNSWTGLVVKNSYVASQKFNAELKAAEQQKSIGWHSTLHYRDGSLVVTLKDRDGNRLYPKTLTATVGRPAFEQLDQRLVLDNGKDGSFHVGVDLAPGEWALRIEASVGTQAYRRDARLYVDDQRSGKLQ